MSQRMERILKRNPINLAVYRNLPDTLMSQFRKAWFETGDFQFVSESKRIELSHEQKQGKEGVMLTEKAIAGMYGDASDPKCQEGAANYVKDCKARGPKWLSSCSKSGLEFFLFVQETLAC